MTNIKDLDLPKPATDYLISQGFTELYPPQADAVDAGLMDDQSILVSSPTASGKTLIAMLAMLGCMARKKAKIVYLSPLRALAAEKFAEFAKLSSIDMGRRIKVEMSTGDYDSSAKKLDTADILILTNERMDSLMRHGADWIYDIDLVISDEIHLIGDDSRGPTLEMILTKLKMQDDPPQIVALSATVTNAPDVADWLGCRLVSSDWRPVPLEEGVCQNGSVTMIDGRSWDVEDTLRGVPVDLGIESVSNGGQSLLFAFTRRNSVSLATKASKGVIRYLTPEERQQLEAASKKILDASEHTELVKTLAEVIKDGAAFHHAGLNPDCRRIVEEEYRGGNIKILASTPTLAAGVNLPARRVVVSSIFRYDGKKGAGAPISVLEYKQLCGRAGRPQYDKSGEAIIVTAKYDADEIIDHYVHGEPEPIESKITSDEALRVHTLSVIVTSPGIKRDKLLEFFLKTLGGAQSSKSTIKFGIDIATRFLQNQKLITSKSDRFAATEFGKKISMLYIDPMTAISFRDALEDAREGCTLGFLHLITQANEFYPKLSMTQKDLDAASLILEDCSSELLEPLTEEDCSRSLLALHYWVTERSELNISESFKVESGDMHRMTETAGWLTYCLREIARHMRKVDLLDELDNLRHRITYGIKPELLDLVSIKGIGRVRARRLYAAGIKTPKDIAGTPADRLAKVDKIGQKMAVRILRQVKS